jgi:hypothetical protein
MGETRPALEAPEAGTLKWRPRRLPLEEWGELLRRLRPVGLGIGEETCGQLSYRFAMDRWWWDDPAVLRRWLRDLVQGYPLPEIKGGRFGWLCAGLRLPLWEPTRIWAADVPPAVEELLDAVYHLDIACASGDPEAVQDAARALQGESWRPEMEARWEASRPDGHETQAEWVAADSRVPPRRPGRPTLEHVRPVVAEVATWLGERQRGGVPWSWLARGLCALGCGRHPGRLSRSLAVGDRYWRYLQGPDVAVKIIGEGK